MENSVKPTTLPSPTEVNARKTEQPIPERILALQYATGLSYGDLASKIGVSRATLHVIRKGQQRATRRFELKLEAFEKEVFPSRTNAEADSAPLVVQALGAYRGLCMQTRDVLPPVPLSYKSPVEGDPREVPLACPRPSVATALVLRGVIENDWEPLVLQCLPPHYSKEEFLRKLDPSGFLSLLQACLTLVFGPDWPTKLKDLEQKLQVEHAPESGAHHENSEFQLSK